MCQPFFVHKKKNLFRIAIRKVFFGDLQVLFPWGVKEVDNHKGDNYPLFTDYYYYNEDITDSFLSVLRLFPQSLTAPNL